MWTEMPAVCRWRVSQHVLVNGGPAAARRQVRTAFS